MIYMSTEIKRIDLRLTKQDQKIVMELFGLTGIKSGADLARYALKRLHEEETRRVQRDSGTSA